MSVKAIGQLDRRSAGAFACHTLSRTEIDLNLAVHQAGGEVAIDRGCQGLD